MTRLIDADALYENLGFAKECEDCDHQYNSVFCESSTWQVVCDAIYEAPTIDVPQWIPCEERLPEEYNPYLVYEEDGECIVHWLEDADWARRMIKNDGIVAWMPLPDPYVGERKDDD